MRGGCSAAGGLDALELGPRRPAGRRDAGIAVDGATQNENYLPRPGNPWKLGGVIEQRGYEYRLIIRYNHIHLICFITPSWEMRSKALLSAEFCSTP